MALYHPHLVTHLFSICTPYFSPNPTYTPLKILTRTALPNFTYQLQFASGDVEEAIQSRSEIRSLLNAAYGGKSSDRSIPLNPEVGIQLSNLDKFGPTRLLTEEELDYYASEFSRHGMHAPLNWYRNREVNWEDEWEHFFRFGEVKEAPRLEQEVLFVLATKDGALKPEMAKGMVEGGKGLVARLRRREVEASHWALWEKPEEVNKHVREWINEVVFSGDEVGDGKTGKESKL